MNIAGLRVRITIQKNETATDQYGNHKSVWQDYFTCWATAVTSGLSTKEERPLSSIQSNFAFLLATGFTTS